MRAPMQARRQGKKAGRSTCSMGWARLLRPRPAQELALQEAWAGVSVTRSLSWGWRCMMCELELAQVSWRLENTYKNIGVWRSMARQDGHKVSPHGMIRQEVGCTFYYILCDFSKKRLAGALGLVLSEAHFDKMAKLLDIVFRWYKWSGVQTTFELQVSRSGTRFVRRDF